MRLPRRRERLSSILRRQEVRLIDVDGGQIGVMNPEKALSIAEGKGLDLVEVAPKADPPVCRIVDYGKHKYRLSKREKAKKQGQKAKAKVITLSPTIAEHDYQLKKRQAEQFLLSGAKVTIAIFFKGRQRVHPELGRKLLRQMSKELSEAGEVLSPPKMIGYKMSMIMVPRSEAIS